MAGGKKIIRVEFQVDNKQLEKSDAVIKQIAKDLGVTDTQDTR
jgi:hypothetical protein